MGDVAIQTYVNFAGDDISPYLCVCQLIHNDESQFHVIESFRSRILKFTPKWGFCGLSTHTSNSPVKEVSTERSLMSKILRINAVLITAVQILKLER